MNTDPSQRFAFVFPGQGSQSLGMLAELGAQHREVVSTFEQASEVVGIDLWRLSQSGREQDLNRTENTQPALLAAGVACWRVWKQLDGPDPELMAGHSLGEYTALVAAGSLGFEDGVNLVAERGRVMQGAVPEGRGAMAAVIGLDDAEVEAACNAGENGEVVSAANYNAPGQVVIAGDTAAVDRALEEARSRGAKRALKLPVSVPSHCRLMEPAAEALRPALEDVSFGKPGIPVIHNVDVAGHEDAEGIREVLLRQLFSPVRWTETVRVLAGQGIGNTVECGPGKVLSGLVRRTQRDIAVYSLADPAGVKAALAAFTAKR